MKSKTGMILLLSVVLFECSCHVLMDKLKQQNRDATETIILYANFNINAATCFTLKHYKSKMIIVNALDSIVDQEFTCDTTYENDLGYTMKIDIDSTKHEHITIEQAKLLDIYYSYIDGIFTYKGKLFLISGEINPELFEMTGRDTCLVGIKPEILRQKWFSAPCLSWDYVYDGKELREEK